MVNKEFQELFREWSVNLSSRKIIEEKMKENLIKRNGDNVIYTFDYTTPGKVVNIETCNDVTELFAVNGDMNPLAK